MGISVQKSRSLLPWPVPVLALIGAAVILLPLFGIIARVPWGRLGPLLTSADSWDALKLSIITSAVAALFCVLLGAPLALVLGRTRLPGRGIMRALVLLPLVLPPVVGGFALLLTYGRQGILAPALDFFGIRIAFTTVAVILAQTFVALPFTVLSLEGALQTGSEKYEQVAAGLGASRGRILWRITLPLLLPALISGGILSFARALGEFGATLTFAGSLQGTTRTLPLEIYLQREVDPDAAAALSLLLVLVAGLVVLFAYRNPQKRIGVGGASKIPGKEDAAASSAEGSASSSADILQMIPAPEANEVAPLKSVQLGQALPLHAKLDLPERGVKLELEVAPGRTLAIVGPNGAGKSSTFAALTGMIDPGGYVKIGERDISKAPLNKRRIAHLSQDAMLFPHLSLLDNVAFAPISQGMPAKEAKQHARELLQTVGLGDYINRLPRDVSGGQAQRAAIARAMAGEPDLVLLDEPFAALDVEVTPGIRRLLAQLLRGRTAVIITHDMLDVVAMADDVMVIENGHVTMHGSMREVLARPTSAFLGTLAGLGVLPGEFDGEAVVTDAGLRIVGTPDEDVVPGDRAVAVIDPATVSLYTQPPVGSPRTVLELPVQQFEQRGRSVLIGSSGIAADVTVQAAADLGVSVGDKVFFVLKARAIPIHKAPAA